MATAVMTDINPFLVKLHEPFDLPYMEASRWECPRCGRTHDKDEWRTRNVQLESDDTAVTSFEECPWCDIAHPEDSLISRGYWECQNCGETYGSSHEAMTCCPGDMCSEEDGHCKCRDGLDLEVRTDGRYADKKTYAFTTFFHCNCGRNEGEQCELLVCIVCHQAHFEQAAKNHTCPGDPVTWEERQAKLREIAAEVTNEVLGEVESAGCMCSSGFCCELHGAHVRPHMLCEKALG